MTPEEKKIFSELGFDLASLSFRLAQAGAWESFRLVQKAQDTFQNDVARILKEKV